MKTRNPKPEIRNKHKTQNSNSLNSFEFWSFEIRNCFEFSTSNLGFVYQHRVRL